MIKIISRKIYSTIIKNWTIGNEYQLSISEISTYCKLDHSWYKVEQHLTSHPQSIDCLTGMFSIVFINFFIFNMTRNLTGPKSIISYIDTQLYHLQWWCWYNLYLYTPYKNFSLASKSFVPFGNESKIGEVHQIWMPICIVTKHKK